MATKKTKPLMDSDVNAIAGKWPKVEIGTHLTVTKYEDGTTILKWDDEQLLKEVQEATSNYVFSEPKVIEETNTKPAKAVSAKKKTKGK